MTKSDDEPHLVWPSLEKLECYSCFACDPENAYYGSYIPCEGGLVILKKYIHHPHEKATPSVWFLYDCILFYLPFYWW